MTVKLLTGMASNTCAFNPGEVVSFDEDTEARLIERGMAEKAASGARVRAPANRNEADDKPAKKTSRGTATKGTKKGDATVSKEP